MTFTEIILSASIGFLVFYLNRIIFDSVLVLREVRREITTTLCFYQNIFGNNVQDDLSRKAQEAIRDIATRYKGHYTATANWLKLVAFGQVERKSKFNQTYAALIGLSNSTCIKHDDAYGMLNIYRCLKTIQDNLGITIDESIDANIKRHESLVTQQNKKL